MVQSAGSPNSSGIADAIRWRYPSMVPTCMRCKSKHSAAKMTRYSSSVASPTVSLKSFRASNPTPSSRAPSAACQTMRARISPAAFLVKVTAKMSAGAAGRPARTSERHHASTRFASVKVFPEPAFAKRTVRSRFNPHLLRGSLRALHSKPFAIPHPKSHQVDRLDRPATLPPARRRPLE